MDRNKEIFDRILKRDFPDDCTDIFSLIGKNLHRICFVKDFIGLPNVIFFAEKDILDQYPPLFGCFDVDIRYGDPHYNFVSTSHSAIFDKNDIFSELKKCLLKTNNTVYLSFFFKESIKTQDDLFKVYYQIEEDKKKDAYEALVSLRKFPEWYQSRSPEEIQKEIEISRKIKNEHNPLHTQMKNEIMNKIDQAILDGDKDKFLILSQIYTDLHE